MRKSKVVPLEVLGINRETVFATFGDKNAWKEIKNKPSNAAILVEDMGLEKIAEYSERLGISLHKMLKSAKQIVALKKGGYYINALSAIKEELNLRADTIIANAPTILSSKLNPEEFRATIKSSMLNLGMDPLEIIQQFDEVASFNEVCKEYDIPLIQDMTGFTKRDVLSLQKQIVHIYHFNIDLTLMRHIISLNGASPEECRRNAKTIFSCAKKVVDLHKNDIELKDLYSICKKLKLEDKDVFNMITFLLQHSNKLISLKHAGIEIDELIDNANAVADINRFKNLVRAAGSIIELNRFGLGIDEIESTSSGLLDARFGTETTLKYAFVIADRLGPEHTLSDAASKLSTDRDALLDIKHLMGDRALEKAGASIKDINEFKTAFRLPRDFINDNKHNFARIHISGISLDTLSKKISELPPEKQFKAACYIIKGSRALNTFTRDELARFDSSAGSAAYGESDIKAAHIRAIDKCITSFLRSAEDASEGKSHGKAFERKGYHEGKSHRCFHSSGHGR